MRQLRLAYIDTVECVQHCFKRIIPDMHDIPYEQRLSKLHPWTPEERRNRADIMNVFKVKNGLRELPFDSLFMVNKDTRTIGHSFVIVKR